MGCCHSLPVILPGLWELRLCNSNARIPLNQIDHVAPQHSLLYLEQCEKGIIYITRWPKKFFLPTPHAVLSATEPTLAACMVSANFWEGLAGSPGPPTEGRPARHAVS